MRCGVLIRDWISVGEVRLKLTVGMGSGRAGVCDAMVLTRDQAF